MPFVPPTPRPGRLTVAVLGVALLALLGCAAPAARPTPVTVVMPTPATVVRPPPPSPVAPSIRISSPVPVKSVRRAFDEPAGEIGGGWVRRAEPGAPSQPNALCQFGGEPSLLLLSEAGAAAADRFADGKVSTQLNPGPTGAAGLVLRAQDERTFYLVRADAAAGTIGIYRRVSGAETRIAETKAPLRAGRWAELRATISDNTLFVWLDNQQLLSGADDAITQPGQAGLWAAAGSAACFDDAVAEWR